MAHNTCYMYIMISVISHNTHDRVLVLVTHATPSSMVDIKMAVASFIILKPQGFHTYSNHFYSHIILLYTDNMNFLNTDMTTTKYSIQHAHIFKICPYTLYYQI